MCGLLPTVRRTKVKTTLSIAVKTGLRGGELTVYGTLACGWTQKQLAYLDDKGIPYTFVNCSGQQGPPSITAYPTLNRDGEWLTGYTEL